MIFPKENAIITAKKDIKGGKYFMDKKKLFTASLASVAVLGAGFLASHPSVVKAEETASSPLTKEDVADYFTDLEKQAEEAINKNDKITDKEAAILAAKAAIGKDDLLKAIDDKEITPEEVLKDLAKSSETESNAPTSAPGAELVRNESGEVTEVKPLNGGIPDEVTEKINKRLDEENTDVKDAEERLAAAKHDEKEAESNREEAKAAVEAAKENVKAAQEELAAAKESKAKFEKELASYKDADGEQADQYREAARADLEKAEAALKDAEETLKQAEKEAKEAKAALEQADEDYYSYVADREAEEVRVLRRQIAKDKADGKDTTALEEELDIALNGVQPLVQPDLLPYIEAEQPKLPNNGGPYPGDRYIINKPTQTPASTPAESSGSTTPSTPANETPATPAPGADTPAAPTATTAPAVAGTSQDNTYQAPAAKAEDKKELPNTGGKDNAAIASLGFLGLLLGALPFVKRKN